MKRERFASSKLFAKEDGFLSFGVLGGLIPRPGGSVYPPSRVSPDGGQVGRWQLLHRQLRPSPSRWSPGTRRIVNPCTTDTFWTKQNRLISERNKINIWLRSGL